jgi:hypothetical protein
MRRLCFLSVLVVSSLCHGAEGDKLPPPELTEVWEPVPPVVTVSPEGVPSDAVVLFAGNSFDAWESAKGGPSPWQIVDGAMVIVPKTGSIRTKSAFGSMQLHLEFRSPAEVKGDGQGRGNSGVLFMGLYELQVLDSYENKTYVNGQAGSVYKQYAPLVNASRAPGQWQVYDVIWTAPRFSDDGSVVRPARLTVFHNGMLVQNNVELKGPTLYRGAPAYAPHAPKLPLLLQNHGDAVSYRNIWVRELPE